MHAPGQEESALVARFKRGDRDAYARLIEIHRRPIFALVYSRLRNYDETRDLVHHVFVEGFFGLDRLRDPSRAGSWFYGIALNLLRKRNRGDSRTVPLEASGEPQAKEIARGAAESMRQALEELPEELRDALVLHHDQGLSYNQISSLLGIPWGTVQGRLARARERLREQVGKLRKNP